MKWLFLCSLFLALTGPGYGGDLRLSSLYSDGMVVQRGEKVVFQGTGVPGSEVCLQIDHQIYRTYTRPDSTWICLGPLFKLNRTYSVTLTSGADTLRLKEIVAGDVWLCSGQSNMEYAVGNFKWCQREVEVANQPDVRFYTVPNQLDVMPAKNLSQGGMWRKLVGDDIKSCSAVSYFFARELHKQVNVPIGIICSDWSGTAIEPWMSKEAIAPFPQFAKEYQELSGKTKGKKQIEQEFAAGRVEWDEKYYYTGEGMEQKWYLPETDTMTWKQVRLTDGYWEDSGVEELKDFDGMVWYRTTFDLPADYKGGDFHLFLNYVKDYNTTWVNGVKVGETFGDKNWSDYYVPEKVLKPKGNVLVVRVTNVEGKGGFSFHPLWATPILSGSWLCKKDRAIGKDFVVPEIINVNPFAYPSILYNAMIAPLTSFPVKGVIWYQGESNGGRGFEYRTLFPALIEDWRQKFGRPQLPFYFVQLANFGQVDVSGQNNDWSELRESQALTLRLPHTGMATAIDLGEEDDIHPQNKQEVGKRLADIALSDCYRLRVVKRYSRIKEVLLKDQSVLVIPDGKLQQLAGTDRISGFSLAGEDQMFYAAQARFDGKSIVVTSSEVSRPVALRYAWGKNPGQLVLIGEEGLPLLPYRSDQWEGVTDKRTYHPDIIYF